MCGDGEKLRLERAEGAPLHSGIGRQPEAGTHVEKSRRPLEPGPHGPDQKLLADAEISAAR
jgi:hypothetical protein